VSEQGRCGRGPPRIPRAKPRPSSAPPRCPSKRRSRSARLEASEAGSSSGTTTLPAADAPLVAGSELSTPSLRSLGRGHPSFMGCGGSRSSRPAVRIPVFQGYGSGVRIDLSRKRASGLEWRTMPRLRTWSSRPQDRLRCTGVSRKVFDPRPVGITPRRVRRAAAGGARVRSRRRGRSGRGRTPRTSCWAPAGCRS